MDNKNDETRRNYMNEREQYLKDVKRIVVKVGTSTLTHPTGLLDLQRIEQLVRQLANINNRGMQVVLVSSGAIASGMGELGLKEKPKTIPGKLKDNVCSPGGTTIEAVYSLEKNNFRGTVISAMEDCTDKAIEMGKK